MRFLFLPPEHDPDSFIRERGAEAFAEAVASAVPLSAQLLAHSGADCDLSTAEGRARMLAQARPLWSALPEGAFRRQLLPQIARAAQMNSDELSALWGSTAGSPTSRPRASTPDRLLRDRPSDRPAHGARARRAPPGPRDLAVRMLLLHSDWWERLAPDDHQLLHEMGAPYGEVMAWLDRFITDHGPQPWSAVADAVAAEPWAADARAWVDVAAVEDEQAFGHLEAVVHRLWIERLEAQSTALAESNGPDTAQLQALREIRERIKRHRDALSAGMA